MTTTTRRPPTAVGRAATLIAAVAAAVGLVACSSSDARSPQTTASTVAVTAPSTTVVVTAATTDPVTTSSTSITATTSTTAPTSTLPDTTSTPASTADPSSTIFPPAPTIYPPTDPRAEVEAAYYRIKEAGLACQSQLPNCDTSVFSQFYADALLKINTINFDKLNQGGAHARNVEAAVFQVRSVEMQDHNHASVAFCSYDPIVLFQPASEAAPESIVFDTVDSKIGTTTLERANDGLWRQVSAQTSQRVVGGANLCAD